MSTAHDTIPPAPLTLSELIDKMDKDGAFPTDRTLGAARNAVIEAHRRYEDRRFRAGEADGRVWIWRLT